MGVDNLLVNAAGTGMLLSSEYNQIHLLVTLALRLFFFFILALRLFAKIPKQ